MNASTPTNGDGRAGFDVDFLSFEVYQAVGMLSVQLDVKPDEALVWLRAYAAKSDQAVDDIARDIVNRRFTAPLPPDRE